MCSSVGTMYRNVANSGTYGGICVFVCHMLCDIFSIGMGGHVPLWPEPILRISVSLYLG